MTDDTSRQCPGLTFRQLAKTNRMRCQRWHPGFPFDSWTGADWSNAMQGEAGEAGNVVKKLRRAELNTRGALDPSVETLRQHLGDEIADTVIYADLLAQFYGLDLDECVARKFNAVSVREGFPERLPQSDERGEACAGCCDRIPPGTPPYAADLAGTGRLCRDCAQRCEGGTGDVAACSACPGGPLFGRNEIAEHRQVAHAAREA